MGVSEAGIERRIRKAEAMSAAAAVYYQIEDIYWNTHIHLYLYYREYDEDEPVQHQLFPN